MNVIENNIKWNKWKEEIWTYEAIDLLEKIKPLPKEVSFHLILKHSHRVHSNDIQTLNSLGLTPKGLEFAQVFGETLPPDRNIHIYHSASPRCIQTGEMILKGVKKYNNNAKMEGYLEFLSNLGGSGTFITHEMITHSGKGFLEKWISEEYLPSQIYPFQEYCQRIHIEINNTLKDVPNNRLNIYITHDIHIMAMLVGFFNLSVDKLWPAFLGGFGFTLKKDTNLFQRIF